MVLQQLKVGLNLIIQTNMIHYVTFEMVSVTASYRNPDFQNFHKSYPLPPPTTIIGMVGAGMGLSPVDAQHFFIDNDVYVSINGKSEGKANDLWKYNDFKNGSVIIRDLLFDNHYQLVFSSDNQGVIQKIKEAFEYPVFALTTGASDSLVKVFLPSMQEGTTELIEVSILENCVAEDDVLTETFEDVLKRSRSNFSFTINQRQPIPQNLVTRFEYDPTSETRKAISRKTFSFVSERVIIKQPKKGIRIDNKDFHLFKL
jgi:CRISPR-associated protein Cas5t